MPKAAKTVTGKQHRVKRLEGPAAPAAETKAGVKKTARAENAVVKADKPDKVVAKPAKEKPKDSAPGESRVIYIGHIPHGFYEKEMRGFFSQFGDITRVRMSRNKKTGASKHYAWVEFKHASVAKIAAETMDNYLMFDKVLNVKLVPPSALHPDTFKGANRKFVPHVSSRCARVMHNAKRDALGVQRQARTLVRRETKRRAKISAAGIDYEFKGYASAVVPPDGGAQEAPVVATTEVEAGGAKRKRTTVGDAKATMPATVEKKRVAAEAGSTRTQQERATAPKKRRA